MRIMPPQGSVERLVLRSLRCVRERSAMNANPKFIAETARVDEAAVKPMPNSRKVYVEGSRRDLLVPMREIVQSDTPASFGAEKNPAIFVYDTSGPYTDPQARIDIRQGLRSEEHTSELQSRQYLVCRLLLEKKKNKQ